MGYLYLALHYPKPEYRENLLEAMYKLNIALEKAPGLLKIGAWADESGERIIAISTWESHQAFQNALGTIGSAIAGLPFDQWEARPRELIRGEEIVFSR